jgi:cell wall-associated NlpC family hydrolase
MVFSVLTHTRGSPILRAMWQLRQLVQRPRGPVARAVAAWAALTALSMPVLATPAVAPPAPATAASAADPLSRFLRDSGFSGAASNGSPEPSENALIERMRDRASDMVLTAMNFLGVPYKRGGVSAENGFDCSGFTRQVFEASLGLVLPRRADEQAKAPGMLTVKRDELRPGDLVFFNTLRRTFSHVGIYVGDGKFIHAPRTGSEVRVDDMRFAYWAKRFTGARRADPLIDAVSPGMQAATTAVGLGPAHVIR